MRTIRLAMQCSRMSAVSPGQFGRSSSTVVNVFMHSAQVYIGSCMLVELLDSRFMSCSTSTERLYVEDIANIQLTDTAHIFCTQVCPGLVPARRNCRSVIDDDRIHTQLASSVLCPQQTPAQIWYRPCVEVHEHFEMTDRHKTFYSIVYLGTKKDEAYARPNLHVGIFVA